MKNIIIKFTRGCNNGQCDICKQPILPNQEGVNVVTGGYPNLTWTTYCLSCYKLKRGDK